MESDEAAKFELNEFKIKWEKTNQFLRETRVSQKEIRASLNEFSNEKRGFLHHYIGNISDDVLNEARKTFDIVGTDLSLALRKGMQNYDDEKHKRKIDFITAFGSGFIVAIIVYAAIFVIVKLVLNIEIPFCH
ncbi:MAG: hypothetical protein ABR887_06135 [Methanoregulaceae archaeon]|jgi:hypothetical protein